jgi:hypothetical protein
MAGSSAAGSACATLPPTVPLLRSEWWPTSSRPGQQRSARRDLCRPERGVLGRRRADPQGIVDAMPLSPQRPISISASGWARRKFIRASRLCPPARTFASSPSSASAPTASSTEPAGRYRNGAAFISNSRVLRAVPIEAQRRSITLARHGRAAHRAAGSDALESSSCVLASKRRSATFSFAATAGEAAIAMPTMSQIATTIGNRSYGKASPKMLL